MAPRAPWTAPPRLLPVALGVLLLGTARKWWAWCKSKSPPACDPPGQTGSPGATGEAQGARLPQAAMPQSRRRPPLLGQGVLPWPVTLRPTVGSGGRPRPRERPPPTVPGPALRSPRGATPHHFVSLGDVSRSSSARTAVSTCRLEPRRRAQGARRPVPALRPGRTEWAAVPARPAGPRGSRGQPRPRVSPTGAVSLLSDPPPPSAGGMWGGKGAGASVPSGASHDAPPAGWGRRVLLQPLLLVGTVEAGDNVTEGGLLLGVEERLTEAGVVHP